MGTGTGGSRNLIRREHAHRPDRSTGDQIDLHVAEAKSGHHRAVRCRSQIFLQSPIDGLPEGIVMSGECEATEGRFLFSRANANDLQVEFRMLFAEGKVGTGDAGVGVNRSPCHGLGRVTVGFEYPDAGGGHAEPDCGVMLNLAADRRDSEHCCRWRWRDSP